MILPQNEPVLEYLHGSSEKKSLDLELDRQSSLTVEIPIIINGERIWRGGQKNLSMPHSHAEQIARYELATVADLQNAKTKALTAKQEWQSLAPEARLAVFEKAADLLANKYRFKINAATMLGQSKNAYQAEIDSACEMIDFFRYNASFYRQILNIQPQSPSKTVVNETDYRPLEGFVAAITPFNFTAIGGNLPTAPAFFGNVALWKPSDTQLLSAYYTYLVLEEAGLPPGVIQFLPSDGPQFGDYICEQTELSAVHFTGSTGTFQHLWKSISAKLGLYREFPRLIGETGGKDFIFADPSADIEALEVALTRGAFEYQGQKCSAASRAYLPKSLFDRMKSRWLETVDSLKMGDVRDHHNFLNAVIDSRSFERLSQALRKAHQDTEVKVLVGGDADSSSGYFVRPTVLQTQNPKSWTMNQEFFGPILSIYVYDDSTVNGVEDALALCESTSPYALTGAIFCSDPKKIELYKKSLRFSAGNFYINDKPTGATVGQQPFGGGRASGTNDKAGSLLNLLRFSSPRTIKTQLAPIKDLIYAYQK